MKLNNEKAVLNEKIEFLKLQKTEDFENLKQQYNATVDSLKPINLIKSVTLELITLPDLKANLINGAISFGTNYLKKNLLNEQSVNPAKRIIGHVLKFAFKIFIGTRLKKI